MSETNQEQSSGELETMRKDIDTLRQDIEALKAKMKSIIETFPGRLRHLAES